MSEYQPSISFARSELERNDMFLAWKRPDEAFFAAGACHILAELFMQLHPDEGYRVVHIKPLHHDIGNHMFATDGEWAFDFNGWTKQSELVAINKAACEAEFPGWECNLVEVTGSFEDYCRQNNHRLPWQFPYLPWERAYNYIQKFDDRPPSRSLE